MYFDRFDIADAYYTYFSNYHGGQFSGYYARLCRTGEYFSPGPMWNGEDTLSDNAREIYDNLVENPPRDSLQPIHERYEVTVGNIGTVYTGTNFDKADETFDAYVADSKLPYGRASGESVVLWENGEPTFEYDGFLDANVHP